MPLSIWSRNERLPCCTFVAAWLIERTGATVGSVSECIAQTGREWWTQANAWDRGEPWSALAAARDMHGGSLAYVEKVGRAPAPPLTPGRWHVVQRWRGLDMGGAGLGDDRVVDGSGGHTYLVHMGASGSCRVLHSSEARGCRDTRGGSWVGTAGLDGYAVGVLTLPADVQE